MSANKLEASDLEKEISRLEKEFKDLLEKIQKSVKHIPVSELSNYFLELSTTKAESIPELFNLLSDYWDYLNPGLLEFLVRKFGSDDDIELLQVYLEELERFQASVKVGDYVRARPTENSAFCYQKIITIMDPKWETKTLKEVERFKKELAKEHRIQPFLARINLKLSSIAIVFCLPHWIKVEMDELEPLFARKKVIQVFWGDLCHIDWTKQVITLTYTDSIRQRV